MGRNGCKVVRITSWQTAQKALFSARMRQLNEAGSSRNGSSAPLRRRRHRLTTWGLAWVSQSEQLAFVVVGSASAGLVSSAFHLMVFLSVLAVTFGSDGSPPL